MSQEIRQTELREKTQRLMDGPLKHIRAAALAAALLPLASVAATPASAQPPFCGSGGICGLVWNDANDNGVQDVGEAPIEGAKVYAVIGLDVVAADTGPDGFYFFGVFERGTYTVFVQKPVGTEIAKSNVGDNTLDSDGVADGLGNSVATTTLVGPYDIDTDFGFVTSAVPQPGTGTPGYWKNHPDAWPLPGVTIGGIYYSEADAIKWLGKVGKDKTTTMFSSLVSAILNVYIGNDSSCVATTIAAAKTWMATYGPVGSNVAASSDAWSAGEPLHRQMDAYNNGRLCAAHRD